MGILMVNTKYYYRYFQQYCYFGHVDEEYLVGESTSHGSESAFLSGTCMHGATTFKTGSKSIG